MRRWLPVIAAAAVLAASAAVPALGASGMLAGGSQATVYACVNSTHQFTHVSVSSPLACPSQQASGTIDIKAGLDWLVSNGFETGPPVISQLNTGWEITSADNATFTMNSYSIQAG